MELLLCLHNFTKTLQSPESNLRRDLIWWPPPPLPPLVPTPLAVPLSPDLTVDCVSLSVRGSTVRKHYDGARAAAPPPDDDPVGTLDDDNGEIFIVKTPPPLPPRMY